MSWFVDFFKKIFASVIIFFQVFFSIIKALNLKAYFILSVFLFGILGIISLLIYLVFKNNTIRRYGNTPDSWLKEKIKIFLGLSKEKDCVEEYFKKTNNILKSFLKNSSSYKYELPWYLTFGLSQAGKSTFLNCIELDTPIDFATNNDSYLNNYFFNDGIVIDVKSELIFNDSVHDFSWDRLLDNLKATRENKSIDGVIYFVSLKDLLSENANDCSKMKRDAEFLYAKLWEMQLKFEMKIPVYIIFTHLDYLAGYAEFIEKVKFCKDDMFGWSNPNTLDARFSVDWLNNMFFTLEESLKFIQSEMMVTFPSETSFDMMNFINSFKQIKPKIIEFLQTTFQYNQYAQGLYFRGAYFTSIEKNNASVFEKSPFLNADEEIEHHIFNIVPGKLYFGKDLLVKKIFAEKNIGKNEIDKKLFDAYVKKIKICNFSFFIWAVFYIFKLQKEFVYIQDSLQPKILKITEILGKYEVESNFVDTNDFFNELKIVLIYLENIASYDLFFYGVPSSILSSLDKNKRKLFFKAYNKLVIQSINKAIEKKYSDLAKKRFIPSSNNNNTLIAPESMEEFINLKEVVDELTLLENYESRFRSVLEYHNIANLQFLLNEIFSIKIPDRFANNILLANHALEDEFLMQSVHTYKEQIKKNFNWCVTHFNKICFNSKRINFYFNDLQRLLLLVDNESDEMTYDNMENIQHYISNLINLFNSKDFLWLKMKNYNSKIFEDLLDKIAKSKTLDGNKTSEKIFSQVIKSYKEFKSCLAKYPLPLLGSAFYLSNNKKIEINESVYRLHGILNDIFSESFMQYSKSVDLKNISSNLHIKWDFALINEISDIIKSYENFLEKLPNNKFEKITQIVANKNIKNLIEFKLSKAKKVVILENDNAFLSELSENINKNSNNIYNILNFLKKIDKKAFSKFLQIEKYNLIFYLACVDKVLESDDLYKIKSENIGINVAKKKVYFKINLKDYLDSNQAQLTFYVDNLASCAIKCLKNISFLSENKKGFILAEKFRALKKDLKNYKLNPANTVLYQLESFYNSLDSESLSLSIKEIKNDYDISVDKSRFLEDKIIYLKNNVNKTLNHSIKELLQDQYNLTEAFYKEYSLVFPFDAKGPLIGLTGFDKMVNLVNGQKDVLEFIKIIDSSYQSSTFDMVDYLSKSSRLIKYIRNDEEFLLLQFKAYQQLAQTKEKNLRYLINFSASVNNQKSVNIFSTDELRIYDSVDFNIELAKGYGLKIIPIDKEGYKVIKNTILKISLSRKELVKFLLENVIILNNQSFIKFSFDFENEEGIKDEMTIMIPINLTLDGLPFYVPQKSFKELLEENMNELPKDTIDDLVENKVTELVKDKVKHLNKYKYNDLIERKVNNLIKEKVNNWNNDDISEINEHKDVKDFVHNKVNDLMKKEIDELVDDKLKK